MAKVDLSKQDIKPTSDIATVPMPKEDDFSGVYRHLNDGLLYELAVVQIPDHLQARITHHLRVPAQTDSDGNVTHPGFSWAGTKDEFKSEFEKV